MDETEIKQRAAGNNLQQVIDTNQLTLIILAARCRMHCLAPNTLYQPRAIYT